MRMELAPSYLRGRLARRLLAVFVLVSVLPVLLISLIAYRQLVLGARTARFHELHEQIETASLAFLAQLQAASARLDTIRPGQTPIGANGTEFEHVTFAPFTTRADRARALSALPQPMRAALEAGRTAITWARSGNRPILLMTRLQRRSDRLVRGQLATSTLLAKVAAPDGPTSIALVDIDDSTRAIFSTRGHLPPALLTSPAGPGAGQRAAREWQSAGDRWLGATWELFLPGTFAAPPVRLVVGEAAQLPGGLTGLRWMIPLALLGAMIFAVLLAIRQLRRYLGPLETLTIATRRLTQCQEHTRIHIETGDELALLGEDFNRMAEELLRRAQFDRLTGLANRDFFSHSLGARLASAAGASTALLYIDLDGFKKINDSVGHEAGDAVLVAVAARLRSCVSADTLLARLGGDEFAIILTSDTSGASEVTGAQADALAEQILRALQLPFLVRGYEQRISASIGVALAPGHGDNVESLLRNADIAMYAAKDSGRCAIARFNAAMHESRRTQILLEAELKGAIARDELVLFYQPITDGERLTGVEALVRWRRASGEQVNPSVFIPLAERSSLIIEIGAWVLRRGCKDFSSWQAAGIAPEYISINVAPRQLLSAEFLPLLYSTLENNAIPPARLHVEITESAVAEGQRVEQVLQCMSELGVSVALDDFGTGYSSLSQLHRLPFDVIKIDRSFLTELPGGSVALQLVRAILSMGHSLQKEVLAEGVETEAQRQLLKRLGCDSMQGYLMGRPMSETALRARLLSERKQVDGALCGARLAGV